MSSPDEKLLPWGRLVLQNHRENPNVRDQEKLARSKHCIGRVRTRCDILIDKQYISGLHCIISFLGKDSNGDPIVELEDKSRYGTFVNNSNKKIGYRNKTNLKSGDLIHLSSPNAKETIIYRFEILPSGLTPENEARHAQLSADEMSVAGRTRKRILEETQNTQSPSASQNQISPPRARPTKKLRHTSAGSMRELSSPPASQREPEVKIAAPAPSAKAAGKKRHRPEVPAEDSVLGQKLKKQLKKEYDTKIKGFVEAIAGQKQELDQSAAKLKASEEKVDALEQNLETLKKSYEEAANERVGSKAKELAALQQEHEAIKKTHEEEVQALKAQAEVSKKAHQEELQALKAQADASKRAHEEEVSSLKAQAETSKKSHEEEVSSLKVQANDMSQKLDGVQRTLDAVLADHRTPPQVRSVVELEAKVLQLERQLKSKQDDLFLQSQQGSADRSETTPPPMKRVVEMERKESLVLELQQNRAQLKLRLKQEAEQKERELSEFFEQESKLITEVMLERNNLSGSSQSQDSIDAGRLRRRSQGSDVSNEHSQPSPGDIPQIFDAIDEETKSGDARAGGGTPNFDLFGARRTNPGSVPRPTTLSRPQEFRAPVPKRDADEDEEKKESKSKRLFCFRRHLARIDSSMFVPKQQKQASLGRAVPDKTSLQSGKTKSSRQAVFELDTYVDKQDFAGALTLLRVMKRQQHDQDQACTKKELSDCNDLHSWRIRTWWEAYCHFYNGNFGQALIHFEQLIEAASDGGDATATDLKSWRLSRACCLFYLQDLEDAEHAALSSSRSALCNRLLFLLAHRRQHSEQALLDRYQQLSRDSIEDQLALAASSYEQRNFQEAAEIYKKLIAELSSRSREVGSAMHVYLALCYFKMNYYDVALELLAVYLAGHPESFFATNLKASCNYRLYGAGEAKSVFAEFVRRFPNHPCAQATVDLFCSRTASSVNADPAMADVMQHNLTIFRVSGGDESSAANQGAERLLSPMVGHLEEAQLNLVLLHLKHREYYKAFALVEDLEPRTPAEQAIKAVLHGVIGEQTHSKEHIFLAEKYFHAAGSSSENCYTIPGRQCMASYFLLRKEFSDANVYLSSIATYLSADDAFNWNYGISLAATGAYREAEEMLVRVQNSELRSHVVLCGWLARCYIQSGRASLAWEIYLKMENSQSAFALLKQIANDCYKMQDFFYAVKAFDVLERLDSDPEYWEGKRGACLGFFRQVACGQEREHGAALSHRCEEVLKLLGNSKTVMEDSKLVTTLRKWVVESLELKDGQ